MKTFKVILIIVGHLILIGFVGWQMKKIVQPNQELQYQLNDINKESSKDIKEGGSKDINEFEETNCRVTSNVNPNGVLIRYTRPEPIGENDRLQYGVSLQTDGDKYFLAVLVRFARSAYRVEGDLNIRFSEGFSSQLSPEVNELTYGNGSEVLMVLYELSDWDMENIKSGGEVESLNFKTEDGVTNIVMVKGKGRLLKQHYSCLQ